MIFAYYMICDRGTAYMIYSRLTDFLFAFKLDSCIFYRVPSKHFLVKNSIKDINLTLD